jgi:hypothetical protein
MAVACGAGDNFWPRHLNCSEYVAALKERIVRDVSAFKGKFTTYDVFNEVIKFPGMLEKCNLWDTAFPGEQLVLAEGVAAEAVLAAAAAGPAAAELRPGDQMLMHCRRLARSSAVAAGPAITSLICGGVMHICMHGRSLLLIASTCYA